MGTCLKFYGISKEVKLTPKGVRVIPPKHRIIYVATTNFKTMLMYDDIKKDIIFCSIKKRGRENSPDLFRLIVTSLVNTKKAFQALLYNSSILYSKVFIYYDILELCLLIAVRFRATLGYTQNCNLASIPTRLLQNLPSPPASSQMFLSSFFLSFLPATSIYIPIQRYSSYQPSYFTYMHLVDLPSNVNKHSLCFLHSSHTVLFFKTLFNNLS